MFNNRIIGKVFQNVLITYLFMLCVTPLSFAQTITIRAVDVTSGHSLKQYRATIWLLYTKQDASSTKQVPELEIQSDSSGIIRFSLPEQVPQRLFIRLILKEGHWRCGSVEFADSQELIQKGIVGLSPSPKSNKTDVVVKAMPVEIVFLARPMTFFERLLYPLVKS